eukprot:scaffold867_cov112-Cylindrotheca_fusiformis.AAC.8
MLNKCPFTGAIHEFCTRNGHDSKWHCALLCQFVRDLVLCVAQTPSTSVILVSAHATESARAEFVSEFGSVGFPKNI